MAGVLIVRGQDGTVSPPVDLRVYVWMFDRGVGGEWVHRDELFIGDRSVGDDLRTMYNLVRSEGCRPDDTGRVVTAVILEEIKLLRASVDQLNAPLKAMAEEEGRRACSLADTCQSLEDKLRDKRAECEVLREQLAGRR